jgi:hypothetical protein
MQGSCRCQAWQATTRHLAVKKIPRSLNLCSNMRIYYLQHVPFEDMGCIRPWAESAGHSISATRFYRDYQLPGMDELDWLIKIVSARLTTG